MAASAPRPQQALAIRGERTSGEDVRTSNGVRMYITSMHNSAIRECPPRLDASPNQASVFRPCVRLNTDRDLRTQ